LTFQVTSSIASGGKAMKPVALIFAMLLATSASAEAIKEWKTPDGKTYFGDHPPKGSTVVNTVDKPIGTVETQPVTPRERVPLAEPQPVWRTNLACQDLSVTGVEEVQSDGVNRRLRGIVTHDGRHIVKDVRVCGGGVCDIVKNGAPMAKGERAQFYLDTNSSDSVSLRIECSVRQPS
jgi:hypothetical protein